MLRYFLILSLAVCFAACASQPREIDVHERVVLNHEVAQNYIKAKQRALLEEYQKAERAQFKVAQVRLRIAKKEETRGGQTLWLRLSQQVEDEFGKRLKVYEDAEFEVWFEARDSQWIMVKEKRVELKAKP